MLTAFVPGQSARAADLALKSATCAESAARQCAVLWFGEIHERGLFRELGYSSMPQYARVELGFSETRISDFMRLTRKLEALPALEAALPEIRNTKAREIVEVASPATEAGWVEAARSNSRTQLTKKIKRVKAQSRQPAAALFAPADDPALAAEVPVRVSVEFTPEQFARWEALWEQVRKRGTSGDRAEVLLEALSALGADFPGGSRTRQSRFMCTNALAAATPLPGGPPQEGAGPWWHQRARESDHPVRVLPPLVARRR